MKTAVAFYLAHEALAGDRPPTRRRRRPPRPWRALLLAAAATAILLGALSVDAVGHSAPSDTIAQPGGVRHAGMPEAKKRSANKSANKRGRGKRRGGRRARVRRVDLFYRAKITGTGTYEFENKGPAGSPDSEYTSPESGYGGARLGSRSRKRATPS